MERGKQKTLRHQVGYHNRRLTNVCLVIRSAAVGKSNVWHPAAYPVPMMYKITRSGMWIQVTVCRKNRSKVWS